MQLTTMNKDVVHFSLWSVCASFLSACTLEWCYDSNLFGAERTEKDDEVTCPACLESIKEFTDAEKEIEEALCDHKRGSARQTSF